MDDRQQRRLGRGGLAAVAALFAAWGAVTADGPWTAVLLGVVGVAFVAYGVARRRE